MCKSCMALNESVWVNSHSTLNEGLMGVSHICTVDKSPQEPYQVMVAWTLEIEAVAVRKMLSYFDMRNLYFIWRCLPSLPPPRLPVLWIRRQFALEARHAPSIGLALLRSSSSARWQQNCSRGAQLLRWEVIKGQYFRRWLHDQNHVA
jgi:hypothetical protein